MWQERALLLGEWESKLACETVPVLGPGETSLNLREVQHAAVCALRRGALCGEPRVLVVIEVGREAAGLDFTAAHRTDDPIFVKVLLQVMEVVGDAGVRCETELARASFFDALAGVL